MILARDHIGQKPLYYAEVPGGLYFASELRGLAAALPTSPEIDFNSLDHYLSMRFIPGSGTMLRGIRKLPPANVLVFDREGVSASRYWKLSFAKKVRMSHEEYIDGLEHKLQEAVAAQLAAGTTTGAFLSGGLDSSLIVAMMAREVDQPVPTFSIGFADKEFDEIPHARVVSETFGTRQFEALADTDLIGSLPVIIKGLGEPSDPVAVSFFHSITPRSQTCQGCIGRRGRKRASCGSRSLPRAATGDLLLLHSGSDPRSNFRSPDSQHPIELRVQQPRHQAPMARADGRYTGPGRPVR